MGILKKVLEEVEKVVHEFKGTLYKSMEDPKIDLTNVSFLFNHFSLFSLHPLDLYRIENFGYLPDTLWLPKASL